MHDLDVQALTIKTFSAMPICVLMFDVAHGTAAVYLNELCSRCSDSRLRSSTRGDFLARRTRTHFADSSFAVAGPAAWNSLPFYIRNTDSHSALCRLLKTYLFTVSDRLDCNTSDLILLYVVCRPVPRLKSLL